MNALPSQSTASPWSLAGEMPDADVAPDEVARGDGAEFARGFETAGAAPETTRAPAVDEAQLAAWIAAIAERDERALTALYDATVSRVYGLVLRILHRPAWVEEVVEDTYFQVWRQALRYDSARGRALTWLLAMARSRAIDALRREARFDHASLDADDGPSMHDVAARSADEWLASIQGQALLHRALLGLGAGPRQLVAMAFFGGLSHEEIAAQTALPLGTVKSQIRRALISLREVLGEKGHYAIPG